MIALALVFNALQLRSSILEGFKREEIALTGKSIHVVFGLLLAVLHLIALAAFAKVEDRSQKEKPNASNEDWWKSCRWERRASRARLRWRTQSYWERSQHDQNQPRCQDQCESQSISLLQFPNSTFPAEFSLALYLLPFFVCVHH